MRLPIARWSFLAAASLLIPACASVQVREDEAHVINTLGIDFPVGGGCVSVELELHITQPPNGVAKAVTTRVTSGHVVSMGNAVDFDVRQTIRIVATVVSIVGNCPPLLPGQHYVFEDVMTRQSDGTYVADLQKFRLVARPR